MAFGGTKWRQKPGRGAKRRAQPNEIKSSSKKKGRLCAFSLWLFFFGCVVLCRLSFRVSYSASTASDEQHEKTKVFGTIRNNRKKTTRDATTKTGRHAPMGGGWAKVKLEMCFRIKVNCAHATAPAKARICPTNKVPERST